MCRIWYITWREIRRWNTILNMLIVGKFIDMIIAMNIIPIASNIFMGVIMMIIGMLVMGLGCYLYIGCGLGCGPRDGVMVGLSKRLVKPIKYIRSSIEITVLILGYFLGGSVGIGTVITALFLGHSIQLIFKICSFDIGGVTHKSITESVKAAFIMF